jgi:hypothetical protein
LLQNINIHINIWKAFCIQFFKQRCICKIKKKLIPIRCGMLVIMLLKHRTFKILITLLYSFFCMIPQRLNFMCRHFRTPCQLHLQRWCLEDGTKSSTTSAPKIKMPGNYPKERKQHSEHSKSLKLNYTVHSWNRVKNLLFPL